MNIIHGDCLEELKNLDDNSIDAVICDPPYGLSNTKPQQVADVLKAWVTGDTVSVPAKRGGFMGKDWDSFVPPPAVWEECMRVLKPGGHMAVFAGARTQDLMGLSIRLAGFEIRDTLGWITGSGFPKSMDISKAIDKAAGAEREEFTDPRWEDRYPNGNGGNHNRGPNGIYGQAESVLGRKLTTSNPVTESAKQWDGWGTALKPAIEPIILARKPLVGTVASNVLAHGVGGLNIDACRVKAGGELSPQVRGAQVFSETANGRQTGWNREDYNGEYIPNDKGRFPANVLLDEHAAKEMDKQSGYQKDGFHVARNRDHDAKMGGFDGGWKKDAKSGGYGSGGGASRFFPVFKYQAKAPKKERPVIEREDGSKIQHPTVKPVALMEWLVELITPPGGVVLDPFAGSGTTLQAALNKGFQPIGIEQDADYIKLIEKRLEATCTTYRN